MIDAALRGLPVILPVLDFSTIKNELFPVIATVFSRTNSLQIKIRGLRAFVILCGGSVDAVNDDGLGGLQTAKKTSSSSALDKYTMQEKIVPLVKAIKTKEPAVMMAAHEVLKVVGEAADLEFVALEILPILWTMGLGPLLSLQQFQTFMELIRNLSRKVEEEHSGKLQELSGPSNGAAAAPNDDLVAFGGLTGTAFDPANGAGEDDFEALVKGRSSSSKDNASPFPSWDDNPPPPGPSATRTGTGTGTGGSPQPPAFSWSTPTPPAAPAVKAQQASSFRTVTPDLSSFGALTPTSTQFSKPLQPAQSVFSPPPSQPAAQTPASSINWPTSATSPSAASNPWATGTPMGQQSQSSGFGNAGASMNSLSLNNQRPNLQQQSSSSFSLPPPPGGSSGFSLAPPSGASSGSARGAPSGGMGMARPAVANASSTGMGRGSGMGLGSGPGMGGVGMSMGGNTQSASQNRSGLDKYESLL